MDAWRLRAALSRGADRVRSDPPPQSFRGGDCHANRSFVGDTWLGLGAALDGSAAFSTWGSSSREEVRQGESARECPGVSGTSRDLVWAEFLPSSRNSGVGSRKISR